MKILVVDDNPINQKFVQYTLQDVHEIHTANDGQEAVDKTTQYSYDLIIMDLMMPVMDGAEATLQIRKLERNNKKHTPILVFTTSEVEDDRMRCFKNGADDFLSKPVGASIFKEKVGSIISNSNLTLLQQDKS